MADMACICTRTNTHMHTHIHTHAHTHTHTHTHTHSHTLTHTHTHTYTHTHTQYTITWSAYKVIKCLNSIEEDSENHHAKCIHVPFSASCIWDLSFTEKTTIKLYTKTVHFVYIYYLNQFNTYLRKLYYLCGIKVRCNRKEHGSTNMPI